MERQDVVDVDGREDDERHGERAHAGAGREADERRHAHAEHGHDRAHEHVDDHGKRGDEQGEQEDVLRHGAGEHDVGDPGVHAGGTAHGAHGHGGRQEHEGLDVDSVPAGGSEDFADDGHGESNANGQGDPADIVARDGEPQRDGDDKPHDGADLLDGELAERGLLGHDLLAIVDELLAGLKEEKAQEQGAQQRNQHRHAHVQEPVDEGRAHAAGLGTVLRNERVERGVARQEEHGARGGSGKHEEAELAAVVVTVAGGLGDDRDDGEDEEGAGERMRDQQRQHKGEREDRDDERLGVAHELEHERVGDALAQARLLDRAGDEVGADDEPHGGLGPRAKRGGDRRRDARGARVVHAHLEQDEQCAVEQAHKARLCHAACPEHHRGERQCQTGLTADRELDRRAQLRQRKKLHQQKDNDTQHKANFALGDLKRLLFRFHLPTFLVGGAPDSRPYRRLKRGARYRTPLTLRCVAAIQSSGFFG